jgi:hypothetical protein
VIEGPKKKEEIKFEIEFAFEKIRFSVNYLIYQRINQWKILDTLALNFHFLTCFVTVFLCFNWQISLFMFLQLLCSVILCWKISYEMYSYGRTSKRDLELQ